MGWVKCQPCIQCFEQPVIVDHMYGSTFRHNKVLIGMWALLPLCECCDSVKTKGSHRGYYRAFGETQAESYIRLMNDCPAELVPPEEVFIAIKDWNR